MQPSMALTQRSLLVINYEPPTPPTVACVAPERLSLFYLVIAQDRGRQRWGGGMPVETWHALCLVVDDVKKMFD